jgi:phage tail tape-measure protein
LPASAKNRSAGLGAIAGSVGGALVDGAGVVGVVDCAVVGVVVDGELIGGEVVALDGEVAGAPPARPAPPDQVEAPVVPVSPGATVSRTPVEKVTVSDESPTLAAT